MSRLSAWWPVCRRNLPAAAASSSMSKERKQGRWCREESCFSWYQGRRDSERTGRLVVRPGEHWRLTVRLKRPHGNANPGVFDYEAWLLERNIRATGYIRSQAPERLVAMVWRPAYLIERMRLADTRQFRPPAARGEPPLRRCAGRPGGWRPEGDPGRTEHLDPHRNHPPDEHLRAARDDGGSAVRLAGVVWLAATAGAGPALAGPEGRGVGLPVWRPWPTPCWPALPCLPSVPCTCCWWPVWRCSPVVSWQPDSRAGPARRAADRSVGGAGGRLLAVLRGRRRLALCQLGPGWRNSGLAGRSCAAWGACNGPRQLASLPVLLLVFQQFSLVSPLANAVAIPLVSFIVTPLALLAALIPWWPIPALAHRCWPG